MSVWSWPCSLGVCLGSWYTFCVDTAKRLFFWTNLFHVTYPTVSLICNGVQRLSDEQTLNSLCPTHAAVVYTVCASACNAVWLQQVAVSISCDTEGKWNMRVSSHETDEKGTVSRSVSVPLKQTWPRQKGICLMPSGQTINLNVQ